MNLAVSIRGTDEASGAPPPPLGGPTEPPQGASAPHPLLASAPMWRREPYRLFFPLGVLLAWAGVLHWLLLATLGVGSYQSIFHSIAQVQGFMMCFAVGFLFTAIPRRTGTAPPTTWEVALGLGAPVATTVAAWFERYAVSQTFWLLLVVTLIVFAVRRFRSAHAGRRPPNGFVWIPLALLMGLTGSGLMGAFGILGQEYFWLHELGKGLLLQGLFLGLVLGVGSMVIPLITRGDAPPDASPSARDRLVRVAHLAGALLLAASFALEVRVDPSLGYALRGAVVVAVLAFAARAWRPPQLPGLHRKVVWVAAWLLPLGYLGAALWPAYEMASLHLVFLGFAAMALAVGVHVTLAHGGYQRLVRQTPAPVVAMSALLALALVARVLVNTDPARMWLWMALASGAFLTATLAWAAVTLPRTWREAAE